MESARRKDKQVKNTFYRMMLIACVVFCSWAAPASGQGNRDEEARKYMVRGMAAIEMAKSEADLAKAAVEFKKATEVAPRMADAWNNLAAVQANKDLQENLGAAAHLIHGSSEGRFGITYAPGHLTRAEIEGAGFKFADVGEMMARYNPATLKDGVNVMPDGEEIFYISNPAIGLWAVRERFTE